MKLSQEGSHTQSSAGAKKFSNLPRSESDSMKFLAISRSEKRQNVLRFARCSTEGALAQFREKAMDREAWLFRDADMVTGLVCLFSHWRSLETWRRGLGCTLHRADCSWPG